MTIAERIIEICKTKENGNMSAFARKTGVTPAYISKLKNNPESGPSGLFVQQVCAKYDVNETWVLSGEGSMHDPVTHEQAIAQVVSALTIESDVVKFAMITAMARMKEDSLRDILKLIVESLSEKGVDISSILNE